MADFDLQLKFNDLSELNTLITVNNVVNPNKVYIKYEWLRNNLIEIFRMEVEMTEIFNSEESADYYPQKDELVAEYDGLKGRFIRVVVEEVFEEDLIFKVWAIDHGNQYVISDPSRFRKLPERFKNIPSPITEMCIDVQPIRKNHRNVTEILSHTEWGEMALENTRAILYSHQLRVDEFRIISGIVYGDILAQHNDGTVISLKQYLIEHNYAVELDYSPAFMKELFESSLGRREFSFRFEDNLAEYLNGNVGTEAETAENEDASTELLSCDEANKTEAPDDGPIHPIPDQDPSDAGCSSSDSSMPPESLQPPSRLYLKQKIVDGKKAFVTEYGPMVEETSEFLASMTTEERFDYDYPLLSRLIKSEELKRQQGQEDNANEPLPSTSKDFLVDPKSKKKTD